MFNDNPSHYTSFLLRVWRVDSKGRCRALLENVATGERVGFDDLSNLRVFLETSLPESDEMLTEPQDSATGRHQEFNLGGER
jgi:hypothetical protein